MTRPFSISARKFLFDRFSIGNLSGLLGVSLLITSVHAQGPQGSAVWNLNANGNWSTASSWAPNAALTPWMDKVSFRYNISSNRTITVDGSYKLRQLVLGDTSSTQIYTISGSSGLLTFAGSATDASPAFLIKEASGGSDTVNVTTVLESALHVYVNDVTNGRVLNLTGLISSGTGEYAPTAGTSAIELFSDTYSVTNNQIFTLGGARENTFEGRVVVNQGTLRTESDGYSSLLGAVGLGNETLVKNGARLDLRAHDFNVDNAAGLTEIFEIEGSGWRGLGALVTTSSGTATISHLKLNGDATVGGPNTMLLTGYNQTSDLGNSYVDGILDANGHMLTKLGIGDLHLINTRLQGLNELAIREGRVRIGGTTQFEAGTRVYLGYHRGVYDVNSSSFDARDFSLGSRTQTDAGAVVAGTASHVGAKLEFHTQRDMVQDLNLYWSRGWIEHNGPTATALDSTVVTTLGGTVHMMGGQAHENVFNIGGGSNAALNNVYLHPGRFVVAAKLDNTSVGNDALGFTKKGARELRLVTAQDLFDGEVIVASDVSRGIQKTFDTTSLDPESQYFNLALSDQGTLERASKITLTSGGSITLLNQVNHQNRINDQGMLSLRNGFLHLITGTETNTENWGNVVAERSKNTFYIDTRAGGLAHNRFASLDIQRGALLNFYGLKSGGAFGTAADADIRLEIGDTSKLQVFGEPGATGVKRQIVVGAFGAMAPLSSSNGTMEGALAWAGSNLNFMTVEEVGGISYLRPLTESESTTELAEGVNWHVNAPLGGWTTHSIAPNVQEDVEIHSLRISSSLNPTASGQAYVSIGAGKTLKIDSGAILVSHFGQASTANYETSLKGYGGSFLSAGGGDLTLYAGSSFWDNDVTSGVWSDRLPTSSVVLRTHIKEVNDLTLGGRGTVYLDSANQFTGDAFLNDTRLVLRHSDAIAGANRVYLNGLGQVYADRGANIRGTDLIAQNHAATTILYNNMIGAASSWTGDLVIDAVDSSGSIAPEYRIHGAAESTWNIYGNIYGVRQPAEFVDHDGQNNSRLMAITSTANTGLSNAIVVNLYGQFRDWESGAVDVPTAARADQDGVMLDVNHHLRFQVRGGSDVNVNAHQRWDSGGQLDVTNGNFRVMYDPTDASLGFFTDAAVNNWYESSSRTVANLINSYYHRTSMGGSAATGTSVSSGSGTYAASILLTKEGQIFNNPNLYFYNNNRNGAVTLGAENRSGTVYFGSNDSSGTTQARATIENSGTEREVRLLQAAGGISEYNLRFLDNGTSVISTLTKMGEGTARLVDNAAGGTNVERWNIMGGTMQWVWTQNSDNRFAASTAQLLMGGGNLEVHASSAHTSSRSQTLNGAFSVLSGSSGIAVIRDFTSPNVSTTLTLGSTSVKSERRIGGTLHFGHYAGNGNSYIVMNGFVNPNTDAMGADQNIHTDRILSWATYGTTLGEVNDFAIVDSLNSNRVVGAESRGLYENSNLDVAQWEYLPAEWVSENDQEGFYGTIQQDTEVLGLRFLNAQSTYINLDSQATLTLQQGAILNATFTDTADKGLYGGNLTSTYRNALDANQTELILHQYSVQGVLSIGSNLIDSSPGVALNLIHTGVGVTELLGENSYTGTTYLLGGKLRVDAQERLGANQSGLYFAGGTLQVTQSMNLDATRNITIGGDGAHFEVDSGAKLSVLGEIAGEASAIKPENGYTVANAVINPFFGDLTKTGRGELVLQGSSNNSNFTGLIHIKEGMLTLAPQLSADHANQNFLGTNHSALDGILIDSGATLALEASRAFSTSDWITFNGFGVDGIGALFTKGTGRTYRLNGQIEIATDSLVNLSNGSTLSLNRDGGVLYGQGDLHRVGNGDFYLFGNSTEYKGNLMLSGGTNVVREEYSKLSGVSSINLRRNALLLLDNSTSTVSYNLFTDRVNDEAAITIRGSGRLRFNADNSPNYSGLETFGNLMVQGGLARLQLQTSQSLAAAGITPSEQYAGIVFNQIHRQAGSVIKLGLQEVNGSFADGRFGTDQFKNVGVFAVKDPSTLTAIGGDGSRGTNHAVVQGFYGGAYHDRISGTTVRDTETGLARGLVTMEQAKDPLTGEVLHVLRPLRDDEFVIAKITDAADFQVPLLSMSLDQLGLQEDDNVKLAGRTSSSNQPLITNVKTNYYTLGEDTTINSLTIAHQSSLFYNTVNTSEGVVGERATVYLGEGVTLKVQSGILNFANLSSIDRGGVESGGNKVNQQTYLLGGSIDFNAKEGFLNAGSAWHHYNYTNAINLYGSLQSYGSDVYVYTQLKNMNGLTKSGERSVILGAINDYTGLTSVVEGSLYLRHRQALGRSDLVELQGTGALVVTEGIRIEGVNLRIGEVTAGSRNALVFESGSAWTGDVIVDDVDQSGQAGLVNGTIQRNIIRSSSSIGTLSGNVYAEHEHQIAGSAGTRAKLIATTGMSDGVLYLRGVFSDTKNGALNVPITSENQNQGLRFEIGTTGSVAYSATTMRSNEEGAVWIDQAWDAVGRFSVESGAAHFFGEGNFWSNRAQQNMNDLNEMSGFHLGGDISTATDHNHHAAFYLTKQGQVFNIGNIGVGLENGLGNITGNSTLGGLQTEGTVQYGLGTGSIFFDSANAVVYDRDLRFYQEAGGTMQVRFNFVRGGENVNTSITKVGSGVTQLMGSSAGDSNLHHVFVNAGELQLTNFGEHLSARLGSNAELHFGGGILHHVGDTLHMETLGKVHVHQGGGQLVTSDRGFFLLKDGIERDTLGTMHFHRSGTGEIQMLGVVNGALLGAYATFGSDSQSRDADSWAALDASGRVVGYQHTAQEENLFGIGLHTRVNQQGLVASETESVAFTDGAGSIASGDLKLGTGGLLFNRDYQGGEALSEPVRIQTREGLEEIFIHNHAKQEVRIAAQFDTEANLVFAGAGQTVLTQSLSGSRKVAITQGATLSVAELLQLGTSPGTAMQDQIYLNSGTLRITGTTTNTLEVTQGIQLGAGGGTLRLDDAESRLIVLGLIGGESNAIDSYIATKPVNNNPLAGALNLVGPGTFQFGTYMSDRTVANSDGIRSSTLTGRTTIGDGVSATHVILQGNPAANTYVSAFGTHVGFEDGTFIRDGSSLSIQFQQISGSTNNGARLLEWMTFGEKDSDVTYFNQNAARIVEMAGNTRVNGTWMVTVQNGGQDPNSSSSANLDFGVNSGYGSQLLGNEQSRIVKLGSGTMTLRENSQLFHGELEVRRGSLLLYGYGDVAGIGKNIALGDRTYSANNEGSRILGLVQKSTSNVNDLTAEVEDLHLYQDIQVYGISGSMATSENNLRAYLYTDESSAHFHGDIHIHSQYQTDGRGLNVTLMGGSSVDPIITGRQQHNYLFFHGDFSGTSTGKNSIIRMNFDDAGSVNRGHGTIVLGGDNREWTGEMRIAPDNNGGVDESERTILRLQNDHALNAANKVSMYYYSTLQVGGHQVTMGTLNTSGGGSGRWAENGALTSNSSSTIENAAKTDGHLTITENGAASVTWHAMFRDGTTPTYFDARKIADGALHLTKDGTGTAVMIQSNSYTGTTTVKAGNLQVGTGVSDGLRSSANTTTGHTGFGATTVMAGATLSGTGVVQGLNATQHRVHGTLAPGDLGGNNLGTLHIDGQLQITSGGTLKFQVSLPTAHSGSSWATLLNPEDPLYTSTLMDLANAEGWSAPVTSTQYDHLELSGRLSLESGSVVEVVMAANKNSLDLVVGDAFNLVDWGEVGGTRNMAFTLPTLSAGLVWETQFFGSHGILMVALIPEPSKGVLLMVALGALTLRRRRH